MENNLCKNCKHYYAHYIKSYNKYRETHFGHCGMNPRKTTNEIITCKNFQKREEDSYNLTKENAKLLILKIHKQLKDILDVLES